MALAVRKRLTAIDRGDTWLLGVYVFVGSSAEFRIHWLEMGRAMRPLALRAVD
jgi:hypothetical protein